MHESLNQDDILRLFGQILDAEFVALAGHSRRAAQLCFDGLKSSCIYSIHESETIPNIV